jgi:hypothetical protein
MGDDSWMDDNYGTSGYMNFGDVPSFQIYDRSADKFYAAMASMDVQPWANNQIFIIENLTIVNDCNGELGGTATLDSCGECSGGSSGHEADSDQDCNGDCFGLAANDSCGVCSGGNSGHTADSDQDCNGDCFGDAADDSCGECSGGNSGHTADSDQDCSGDCFGDDTIDDCGDCSDPADFNSGLDECGVCYGGNLSCADCAGVPNGYNVVDECGECDDDPSNDGAEAGFDCDGTPLLFVYNQSTLQAFYHIEEAYDASGVTTLTPEDWVAIFNDDICVGSRKWDPSLCNSGICDVPAMGDDGYGDTDGYLSPGDVPSFKIYDASMDEYFDAYPEDPTQYHPFEYNGIFFIDDLVIEFHYSIPLHQYNNLISFYVLPEDISVVNVMGGITDNLNAVIGEGYSAQYNSSGWAGYPSPITAFRLSVIPPITFTTEISSGRT